MNSRQRVRAAINHQQPDRVPLDLGSTPVTGIAAGTYARLRQALGLPTHPVKVLRFFMERDESVVARRPYPPPSLREGGQGDGILMYCSTPSTGPFDSAPCVE